MVSCGPMRPAHSLYEKSLTEEEKQQLKEKGKITKNFISHRRGNKVHDKGELEVEIKNGNYLFKPVGTWNSYYRTGQLLYEVNYDSSGQREFEKVYNEDGSRNAEIISYNVNRGKEVVRIEKLINYFHPGKDTASVEIFIRKGNKTIKDGNTKHFDEQGNITKTIFYRNDKKIK